MGNWCEPDHTCKTTACISGWAGILFSDTIKAYLDKTYEIQKLNVFIKKHENVLYNRSERSKAYKEADAALVSLCEQRSNLRANNPEPDWPKEGKKLLGLTKRTTDILFIPSRPFWNPLKSSASGSKDITNRHAALVVRYLAYRPNRTFLRRRRSKQAADTIYNADFMRAYIAKQQAKEGKQVNAENNLPS